MNDLELNSEINFPLKVIFSDCRDKKVFEKKKKFPIFVFDLFLMKSVGSDKFTNEFTKNPEKVKQNKHSGKPSLW